MWLLESESDVYVYIESESCRCCFVSHITLCLWLTVFLCFHHCFVRCVFVFEGDPLPRGNSHKLSSGRNWHWVNTRPGGGEMKRISHLWRKIVLEPPFEDFVYLWQGMGLCRRSPFELGRLHSGSPEGEGRGFGVRAVENLFLIGWKWSWQWSESESDDKEMVLTMIVIGHCRRWKRFT